MGGVVAARRALSVGHDDSTANDTLGDLVMTFPGGVHRRPGFLLTSRRSRSRLLERVNRRCTPMVHDGLAIGSDAWSSDAGPDLGDEMKQCE
jgi:hypothetical protein